MLGDPTFWAAVGFLLFVVLAGKPIYKAMAAGLDSRADKIKATIDDAATLREEAQQVLAEYQRKQRDALKETEQMVAHAKEESERLAEKAVADLDEAVKRREQMAVEKIAQAEAEALRQVRETSIDLAIAASRALIAKKVTKARGAKLIDEAIDELADKLH